MSQENAPENQGPYIDTVNGPVPANPSNAGTNSGGRDYQDPYPYHGPAGPKAAQPVRMPTAQDYFDLTSETGRTVPIVYGTMRVTGNLLEKAAPFQVLRTTVPQWTANTAYPLGSIVCNTFNSYFFLCTTAGTSSSTDGVTGIGNGTEALGAYVTDGSCQWQRMASGWNQQFVVGLAEGTITDVLRVWQDKTSLASLSAIPHNATWVQLLTGTATQTRPTWATAAIDTYSNTACIFLSQGTSADNTQPSISCEVKGLFATAGSRGLDANPSDIVTDILTHARRGAGWPSFRVDSNSLTSGASSARTYWQAADLCLSWAVDSQRTALSLLQDLLKATNTDAVWSGGMLKFVPLCDQTISANGTTFTPNNVPVYALGPDDLASPIAISRISATDTFNSVPVEYINSARDYVKVTVDNPDSADVDQRGLLRGSTVALGMCVPPATAVMLSRIYAQRSLNVRNAYRFELPWRFVLLEPTDLVTLTDPVTGLSNQPVRITEVEETVSETGEWRLTITAEDWPGAVAAAAAYTPQAGDGYKPSLTTTANGIAIGAGQLVAGAVPDSASTRGANVDSLWPNGNSEQSPPDGADLTTGEWAYRYRAAPPLSYAGNWCRMFPNTPGVTQFTYIDVPCMPGDTYYFEAMISTDGAGLGAAIVVDWLNSSGVQLSEVGLAYLKPMSYTKYSTTNTAPADAVTARFKIVAQAGTGAVFDNIYVRRVISGGAQGIVRWVGQFSIAGTATSWTCTLTPAEANTSYAVQAIPVGWSASPPAGAYQIVGISKSAGSFTITTLSAPGFGNTVVWDVQITRQY